MHHGALLLASLCAALPRASLGAESDPDFQREIAKWFYAAPSTWDRPRLVVVATSDEATFVAETVAEALRAAGSDVEQAVIADDDAAILVSRAAASRGVAIVRASPGDPALAAVTLYSRSHRFLEIAWSNQDGQSSPQALRAELEYQREALIYHQGRFRRRDREIGEVELFRAVDRPDLLAANRRRTVGGIATTIGGVLAVVTGMIMAVASIPPPCAGFLGCGGPPPQGNLPLGITGVTTLVIGITGSILGPGLLGSRLTPRDQRGLAERYNRDLRRRLGLAPRPAASAASPLQGHF